MDIEDVIEPIVEYMRCVDGLIDYLIDKDIKIPADVSLPLKKAFAEAVDAFSRYSLEHHSD